MAIKKVGAFELRSNLAKIMTEAYLGSQFLLERNGIPIAVLMGIHDYQQLQEDFGDIKDMLEAVAEDDWVDFDEVIQQREQSDNLLGTKTNCWGGQNDNTIFRYLLNC